MKRSPRCFLYLAATLVLVLQACSPQSGSGQAQALPAAAPQPEAEDHGADLEGLVESMAAVGYAYGASWAPDGNRVAFISSASGGPQVWTAAPDGSELKQLTSFEDQVGGVEWSPTGEMLAASLAPGGGLNTQIHLVSTQGGHPQRITEGGKDNNWLVEWSEDGRYLSYSSNADGGGSMDCWLYDAETGESRQIAENQGIGRCTLSPDASRAVAWRMISRGNTDMYLVDIATGQEHLLTPHEGVALSNQAEFVGHDTLLISSNIDREMIALARIDIGADGVPGPLAYVAGRDDAELAGFEVLPAGRVALNWNVAGRSELQYLDLASGKVTDGPELPAEIAGGLIASPSGEALALNLSGAAVPSDVWHLDIASGQFTRVSASSHEGVDLSSLVRPELLTYTAHDGLELSGWLYRAPGDGGPGPMVLSFHGGPEGQERPAFRSTYQALVASGISVFAPNVRGSAGFGKTFVNLDNGALRFDGIRDIESTVKYVVEAGLAEPGRIGIMGGSYGGYMVMAGLTEYPDLLAAGANLFGVVNFETFFANTEPWMAAISTVEYGDPVAEKELLASLSPIHKVDRVTSPTIVLHGANDTNVPVVEAEQVVASLEQRGVPVKYVLFPDEGHGWRKTENRVTSDVEIVRWFETHL